MPRVSVVMPTHNGASRGFLSFAIESVLQQTFCNLELLVVDDGSTDGTRALCERYTVDPRFRYIFQNNSGVSAARNNGIAQSRGSYIAFLDDDDVWLPEKLAKQCALIEQVDKKNFGLCYTALACIDPSGKKTGAVQSHSASGDVFFEMLSDNQVDCTSSVVVPKKVLDDVGGFKESWSHAEDYDLWVRIAKRYHLYSVDIPLVLYRVHEKKLSASVDKIEGNALCVVSEALKNFSERDCATILNRLYKYRASHRFWRGDFKKFRQYVRCARANGRIGVGLRLRYWLSYLPRFVQATRKCKNFAKRFF